jgi:hypothetical protein
MKNVFVGDSGDMERRPSSSRRSIASVSQRSCNPNKSSQVPWQDLEQEDPSDEQPSRSRFVDDAVVNLDEESDSLFYFFSIEKARNFPTKTFSRLQRDSLFCFFFSLEKATNRPTKLLLSSTNDKATWSQEEMGKRFRECAYGWPTRR